MLKYDILFFTVNLHHLTSWVFVAQKNSQTVIALDMCQSYGLYLIIKYSCHMFYIWGLLTDFKINNTLVYFCSPTNKYSPCLNISGQLLYSYAGVGTLIIKSYNLINLYCTGFIHGCGIIDGCAITEHLSTSFVFYSRISDSLFYL